MPKRIRSAIATLAIVLLAACAARKPGEPLKPGFNVYSQEQDIELGRQAAQQVRQQVDVVNNQELQDYVNTIGNRLKVSAAGDYPYSFTLINDPSINAFALPGGPTFINSGLIAAADNEAQVAGVMAHEIAHVALRHGTSQASKANILQLPAAVAGAVIGQDSVGAQLGQLGIGLGLNALILKYSRGAENEADALGARIMHEAGYNPVEMARFFEKLEAEGGSRAPEFLSSHPNPGNRVQAVQAEIQTFPQKQYTADSGRFPRQKELVARLPQPSKSAAASQQQLASAAAPPAGNFQQFQSGRFTVQHPQGWQAFGQNGSSLVAIAPRQGLVRDRSGNVIVGYGAIMNYYPTNRPGNLRTATSELITQMREGNPALQIMAEPRDANVSGSPALITSFSSASPYGGAERNVLVTVSRPEGVFYMVFVSPERVYGQLEGTFQKILGSIQFRG